MNNGFPGSGYCQVQTSPVFFLSAISENQTDLLIAVIADNFRILNRSFRKRIYTRTALSKTSTDAHLLSAKTAMVINTYTTVIITKDKISISLLVSFITLFNTFTAGVFFYGFKCNIAYIMLYFAGIRCRDVFRHT